MQLKTLTSAKRHEIINLRDARYDSLFCFAVTTTGIYCRPSCPAPRPRPGNVVFYPTAKQAQAAGFRACKRCRPDEAAGTSQQSVLSALQQESAQDDPLGVVATKLNISSRHLSRTVKNALGVTPVQIKQASCLKRASELLAQTGSPIVDVAFSSGFSSLRQFNRSFKTAFGMTPSEYRDKTATSPLAHVIPLAVITASTPVGPFHMITDSQGVVRASGFGPVRHLAERLPPELRRAPLHTVSHHPYQALVKQYFCGDPQALAAIPHEQSGSDFQRRIWQTIAAIPYGRTITYGQLAAGAGNPSAIRAAGTACGKNRLIMFVPCHRVLRKDGSIGSYAYGSPIKEFLLQLEHKMRR